MRVHALIELGLNPTLVNFATIDAILCVCTFFKKIDKATFDNFYKAMSPPKPEPDSTLDSITTMTEETQLLADWEKAMNEFYAQYPEEYRPGFVTTVKVVTVTWPEIGNQITWTEIDKTQNQNS